jgi:hypothetical protein
MAFLEAEALLAARMEEWKLALQGWASTGALSLAAQEALQFQEEPQQLTDLINQIIVGDFTHLPPVRILEEYYIGGYGLGAYSAATNTIYISQAWLQYATQEDFLDVFTNQYGFYLDSILNTLDTNGDEGEYFKRRIAGLNLGINEISFLRSQASNDSSASYVGFFNGPDYTLYEQYNAEIKSYSFVGPEEALAIYNQQGPDIEIPLGVYSIGNSAFLGIPITSVKISPLVRRIETQAFAGTNLSSITFSEGLNFIGGSVFAGSNLSGSIVLPASIGVLQSGFLYGSQVSELVFSEGFTGTEQFFFGFGALDYSLITSVIFPDSLMEVPMGFFAGSLVESVVLPEGVTRIGYAAFQASALSSINLPSSLRSIGGSAFAFTHFDGNALIIPEGVESIGDFAFQSSRVIIDSLPSTLKTLDDYAFYATEINNAILPDGLERLGLAFWGAARVDNLSLPGSLIAIPDNAFFCAGLLNLTLREGITSLGYQSFYNNQVLSSVSLPSTLDSIGDWCFASTGQLTDITIPASLTYLGSGAFFASGLKSVVFAGSLREIASQAFRFCGYLSSVILPTGLELIGAEAFSFSGLQAIELPSTLTSIQDAAFAYAQLTSVSIPSSVTYIGYSAFAGCPLTAVSIPASVSFIGYRAFEGTSISSITLQDGLTSIGQITVESPAPQFRSARLLESQETFASSSISPDVLSSARQSAFDETQLVNGVFSNLPVLDVGLPDSLISIGFGAFAKTQLSTVKLPSSLRTIDVAAFYGCPLTSIELPDTLSVIGDFAFSGTALVNVEISERTVYASNSFDEHVAITRRYINDGSAAFDIHGSLFVGETIRAVLSSSDPDGDGDFVYSWEYLASNQEWIAIAGATSDSLTIPAGVEGKLLRARVSYTDSQNFKEDLTVNAGFVPISLPSITSISINERQVILEYSEAIRLAAGFKATQFRVFVDGKARSIDSAKILSPDSSSLALSISGDVPSSKQSVSVLYSDLTTSNDSLGVVEDLNGFDMDSVISPVFADTFSTSKSVESLNNKLSNVMLLGSKPVSVRANSLSNRLTGNAADNLLDGLTGNDVLTGGPGADQFSFSTSPNSSSNADIITDFVSGSDKIRIRRDAFPGLSGKSLKLNQFASGYGLDKAPLASTRFVFDSSVGVLSYDRDGSGANFGLVTVATFTNLPLLQSRDFVLA